MESLNLSSNPALAERHRLMLEIEGGNDEVESGGNRTEDWRTRRTTEDGLEGRRSRGIVFSPGGNEAFMVTGREEEVREPFLLTTPREVGTRPKTVGQSYDQSSKKPSGGPALNKVAAREETANEEPVAPSPRSQGCLTDRALSPSQASVTSLLSGASTVSNAARRRGLEWDYSEDLGMEEAIGQGQAAASLSTLEKMAIYGVTEFLREEPEGRGEGREPVLPPAPQDDVAQQWRMSKFADSLMKQRQLQEREKQQRRRSLSKERLQAEKERMERLPAKGPPLSPVKFPSMSDVRAIASSSSTDEIGPNSLTVAMELPPASEQAIMESTPISAALTSISPQSLPAHLLSPSRPLLPKLTSPSHPLPPHLADLVVSRPRAVSSSRDSLTLSRTSAGNSIETVVSAHRREEERSEGDTEEEAVVHMRARSTSREDTPSVSSFSEGANPGPRFIAPPPPRHAWREGGVVGDEEDERRRGRLVTQSSEPSSVPSTSDEDMVGPNSRREEGGDSTLESARLIDRAKSFEYIPGSSFPLQENSSSYEYLPGHLVADPRPPTVLTRHASPATTSDLTQGDNLGLVSAELKEKSKELLTANLLQTKHFFKKLKSYIDFLSTPSLTVEDCRVKQELATRITALLSTEEIRLGGSSGRQSGGSFEHKLSLNTSKEGSMGSESKAENSSEQSSLRPASRISEWRSARTRSEEQWSKGAEVSLHGTEDLADVLMQRQQHMRRIRKEMRKLEKLDQWLLSAGRGRLVESVSELSIHTTISTLASDTRVSAVSSRKETDKREKNGRKAVAEVTRELDAKVRSKEKGSKSGLKKTKEAIKENLPPATGADREEAAANFGQMFPSDVEEISRIETRTVTNTTTATVTLQQSVHIQTETVDTSAESSKGMQQTKNQKQIQRSPRRRRTAKSGPGNKKGVKPVAYFLPMETLSPVRLGSGKRVLREVANNTNSLSLVNNLDSPNMIMSAGNREVLAGYIAGLDVARPATAPISGHKKPSSPAVKMPRKVLSLQEALAERRKDFVKQSEARQGALAAAREARLLRREKQSAWLEEIANQSPRLV